jgi:hypothetical protein
VRVLVAEQEVSLQPTQYCDGDTGRRYQVQPPVVGVTPSTQITVTVPAEVARHGWSLQVFDQALEQKLGDVAVPAGADTFAVSSSDVVPATFYLVAVETSDRDRCSGLSGAWPVGFIRTTPGAPSSSG